LDGKAANIPSADSKSFASSAAVAAAAEVSMSQPSQLPFSQGESPVSAGDGSSGGGGDDGAAGWSKGGGWVGDGTELNMHTSFHMLDQDQKSLLLKQNNNNNNNNNNVNADAKNSKSDENRTDDDVGEGGERVNELKLDPGEERSIGGVDGPEGEALHDDEDDDEDGLPRSYSNVEEALDPRYAGRSSLFIFSYACLGRVLRARVLAAWVIFVGARCAWWS
jgi:hypothetical protein